jgi:homoserine kinase type II
MAIDREIDRILKLYPDDCQPQSAEAILSPDSFSGAALWRLSTPRGPLCLRRWPAEHPSPERLQFVQAVLWHVDQEGFHRVPLPLETRHKHGFVRHAGHLWELTPWLPGATDFRANPGIARLKNALLALAHFHCAAHSFPLADPGPSRSPGILSREAKLHGLLNGGLEQLQAAVVAGGWPELGDLGHRLIALAAQCGPATHSLLQKVSRLQVPIEPCIRDVWQANVLFVGDEVTGIVDFGAMRPESVATDVSRLLGSLALDNGADWQRGLAAYESVRQLSDDERTLVSAFDRSTVVMGGLQWLEWVYVGRREFGQPRAVLARVREFLARLERLANQAGDATD